MRRLLFLSLVLSMASCGSCFGSSGDERSYFVLHGVTASAPGDPPIVGLVRVRNLDAASIYEKFQIVVRRNPYELSYSEKNVWAVKPNHMVSDYIAHALQEAALFTAVRRELGELRPDFILGGDLHAIEVYDSGDLWFAHLSLTLSLTRYKTGETLRTFSIDERKPVPKRTFAQFARATSELLSLALARFIRDLRGLALPRTKLSGKPGVPATSGPQPREPAREESPREATPSPESGVKPEDTIYVRERPPEDG